MSGESGKVDILLTKEAAGVQWTELGQGLQGNNSFKPHKERGIKTVKTHTFIYCTPESQKICHGITL